MNTISETLLEEVKLAWCTGVARYVQQTGGLMSTDGLLMKITSCVQNSIPAVASMQG